MAKSRVRLDVLLTEEGIFSSRNLAQRFIMAGEVFVDNYPIIKPSHMVLKDAEIRIRPRQPLYVSRGGLKLEGALSAFKIDLQDRIVLDAGASTGGFTDCLLSHGAKYVYALDVGYGQLSWKLRQDNRVIVYERQHIAKATPILWNIGMPTLITADLSFISTARLLGHFRTLIHDEAEMIMLIKPQFEAERSEVGKNGVVKDVKVHMRVLQKVSFSAYQANWQLLKIIPSSLKGPKGNIEFFGHLKATSDVQRYSDESIEQILASYHKEA